MRIDGSTSRIGIGTNSPPHGNYIFMVSNPALRIQETGQTGYLESTSVVDSQARIKAANNTQTGSNIRLPLASSASTGTEQNFRIFRDSDAAVDGNFRILRVGTTEPVVHVYSEQRWNRTHHDGERCNNN